METGSARQAALLARLGVTAESFAGRVALVTGAAQGIGAQLARALSLAGAAVALVDIRAEGEGIARELRDAGRRAAFFRCDLSSEAELRGAFRAAEDQLGPVDLLVNNAVEMYVARFLETPLEDWDRVIATNLRAVFIAMQEVLPGMLARRRGVVLNLVAPEGGPFHALYAASKVALRSLTLSVARELSADSGVSVYAFFPGVVDTPGVRGYSLPVAAAILGQSQEQILSVFAQNPGYPGLMPVEDCAAALCYSLAHAAKYHAQLSNPFEPLMRFGIIDAAASPQQNNAPTPGSEVTGALRQMIAEVMAQNRELEHLVELRTRELTAAQGALLQINQELEARVAAQVVEITSRAREVEALNLQLQLKVQERSRELLKALRQLGQLGSGELLPGQLFAERVKVQGILGRGGMGVVYLGQDLVSGKSVALKLMHPGFGSDPNALRRFFGEATASSSIHHPGIVKTLHVDVTPEGQVYQLMECVEGIVLSQRLSQGRLSPGDAARVASSVCGALGAAHEAGIIHRDIKPSNLILSRNAPGVRVLDFGISKILKEDLEPLADALTLVNKLMGTPQYMSPEQVRDPSAVTAATDMYSLGIVLFEALSGRSPYDAKTVTGFCLAHLHKKPREIQELVPEVPDRLAQLLRDSLEKDPSRRPSAHLLQRELSSLADLLGAASAEQIALTDATEETLPLRR